MLNSYHNLHTFLFTYQIHHSKVDSSLKKEKLLVFFKIKPDVITGDNLADIFVSSMLDSPISSLYHSLQKLYAPILLKVIHATFTHIIHISRNYQDFSWLQYRMWGHFKIILYLRGQRVSWTVVGATWGKSAAVCHIMFSEFFPVALKEIEIK